MSGELLHRANELSARVIASIWDEVSGYSAPSMRREDLEAGVTNTTRSALRAFVHSCGPTPRDLDVARDIGATRALQGVPLDAVVQAFRRTERIMSEAFVSSSGLFEPEDLRAGLRRLAECLEQLSAEAIASYRQVQDGVTSHVVGMSGGLVIALLSEQVDPGDIAERARLLGLDPSGTYQAVALRVGDETSLQRRLELQRRVLAVLAEGERARILVSSTQGSDLFLVPGRITDRTLAPLREVVAALDDHPVWISVGTPVDGLPAAGRSANQALQAMQIVVTGHAPGTATTFDEVLLEAMLLDARATTTRLIELLYDPLAAHPHLVETVTVFLREGMSLRATAQHLFVHPNTIAYRLSRIEHLSGVDPRVPLDLVRLDLVRLDLAIRAAALRCAG